MLKYTFLLLFLPGLALANGGTIHSSLFKETGNIKLINTKDILLLREDLTLDFSAKSTVKATAVYQLKNGGKARSLLYAFPVDFYLSKGGESLEEENLPIEELIENIRYSMTLNGKAISTDSIVSEKYQLKRNRTPDELLRVWFISKVDIGEGLENFLRITLTTPAEYITSSMHEPAYDYEIYDSGNNYKYLYDLSPAGSWGNGQAGNITVNIVQPGECDNFRVRGLDGFTQLAEKNTLSFSNNNYGFTESSKILVDYGDVNTQHFRKLLSLNRAQEAVKAITVSSTLGETYASGNLIDGDLATAWVEGHSGDGVGEWIEIELNPNFTLTGIALVNGYTKNTKTFVENGKIKSGSLVVSGTCYNMENSQGVKQCKNEMSVYMNEISSLPAGSANLLKTVEFLSYQPFEGPELANWDDSTKIKRGFEFMKPTSIKIKVDEVYEGTKYQDMCISELLVFGYVH
ncbi:MAG: discoidin domain-containing protein [Imperialibacter sp.]|uniref:discoidin domain-containing protein n=1 Tax=Imperialibacter sp. TaxID=2038411 RepID=UPI0032F02C07